MWPNPQKTADLVTLTEEILNGKLHFLWVALVYPDENQIDDFVKQYIAIEPFHFAKVHESVFNGYPKFRKLVLNIGFTES